MNLKWQVWYVSQGPEFLVAAFGSVADAHEFADAKMVPLIEADTVGIEAYEIRNEKGESLSWDESKSLAEAEKAANADPDNDAIAGLDDAARDR